MSNTRRTEFCGCWKNADKAGLIFIRAGILSSRQESMIYRNKLFAGINDFQTLIITGINYLKELIIYRN